MASFCSRTRSSEAGRRERVRQGAAGTLPASGLAGMVPYLVNRMIQSAVVLLGTSLLVFGLLRIVPSDPVDLLTRPGTPEHLKEEQRRALGLDQPLYVQYGVFLRNALQGDFGNSFRFNQPASTLVLRAFPATLALTLLALGLGYPARRAAGSSGGHAAGVAGRSRLDDDRSRGTVDPQLLAGDRADHCLCRALALVPHVG